MSEVLITLGITGVVAAMTIPTLVNKYQKKVIATQLKAVYSELQQTFNAAMSDNGDPKYWAQSIPMENGELYYKLIDSFYETYLLPYIRSEFVKGTEKEIGYQEFTGTLSDPNVKVKADSTQFIKLVNGTVIRYTLNNNGIEYSDILLYVDVNGCKKPNIMGKDIFLLCFSFKTGRLSFYGAGQGRQNLLYQCGKSLHGDQLCGQIILLDDWEIKEDYPW